MSLGLWMDFWTEADWSGIPDLSWLSSYPSIVIRQPVIVHSSQGDASWFFSVGVVPDLSSAQASTRLPQFVPSYQSLRTNLAGFLSPPVKLTWYSISQRVLSQPGAAESLYVDVSEYLPPLLDVSWLPVSPRPFPPQPVTDSLQVDPSEYLAPPIDLSWLQSNKAVVLYPIVTVRNSQGDASWFLQISTIPNLSWIPVGKQPLQFVPGYQSLRASLTGFLSPPTDLAWSATSQRAIPQPVIPNSRQVDVSDYLAPPIDFSWLVFRSTVQSGVQSNQSTKTDLSFFPDLSWLQQNTLRTLPLPIPFSSRNDPGWFLSVSTLDLSWLQSKSSAGFQTSLVQSSHSDPAWFLNATLDISWLISSPRAPSRLAITDSAQADSSEYLAPAIDLSWLVKSQGKTPQPTITDSGQADPTEYLIPPLDISWLVFRGNIQAGIQRNQSTKTDPSFSQDMSWLQQNILRTISLPIPFSARSDPAWFLSVSGIPDLSWLQSKSTTGSRSPVFESKRNDPTWFLTPSAAPDLSWVQSKSSAGFPTPITHSAFSNSAWFLTVSAAPDLSWTVKNQGRIFQPAITPSSQADPTKYLLPPLDASWLVFRGNIQPSVQGGQSRKTDPSFFLDLGWLQQNTLRNTSLPVAVSFQVTAAWFLSPSALSDVSWVQNKSSSVTVSSSAPSGSHSDPEWFLKTTLDISWTQNKSSAGSARPVAQGISSTNIWFLSVNPAPDVSWMPTSRSVRAVWGILENTRSDPGWFLTLAAAPDLSWLQSKSSAGIVRRGFKSIFSTLIDISQFQSKSIRAVQDQLRQGQGKTDTLRVGSGMKDTLT